ncbi:MAG TPA: CBS domain-containing protein [Terriglobales bacterium]|jgi:CBS domain-containing protein|nr:CBS domain-containing protein [Terriglobales bacterium]
MQISEVMTRELVSCMPVCSAQGAAEMMRQHDIGILPVVFNRFSRKLLGVVTDRDLCLAVVASGHPAEVEVQECMTADVVTCAPHDDVQVAIHLMQEHQVRRLPVVDAEGRLAGMLSLADLVRHGVIDPKDLYLTLRKICEVRPRGAKRIA